MKKIFYNPFFIKMAKILGIRSFLRKVYYYFWRPKNNILDINIAGTAIKIYVTNPDELRLAESISGDMGEKKVMETLMLRLREGDIFFDVGANIGIYSAVAAKLVGKSGKVFAFEPESETIKRLKENFRINNLNNAFIVEKALGEKNGSAKLYIGETTGNFSLVNLYEKELKCQDVEIKIGDEFVKESSIVPNVIKVDVEGYEHSVLSGLKNTLASLACRIVCCEMHIGLMPELDAEKKIFEMLNRFGFRKIETFKRPFSAYHIIAEK